MTDEMTDEEATKAVENISRMVDELLAVLVGEPRDHMMTAFAYIVASNINSDQDANELLPDFVEQICGGWREMRDRRSFQ